MLLATVVVGLVALAASALSLVSGFGLGTLLLPAFALFFPVPVAVAATAVVHVAHNVFKLALLVRHARPWVLLAFGLPAALAAFPGAALLTRLAGAAPLADWRLGPLTGEVTPVALVTGLLILAFGVLEGPGPLDRAHVSRRWLPLGGALSGFLGGLSGHQGALRAAFLQPLGLPPPAWAGTQAALAVMVDVARLAVYGAAFLAGPL
ncbi:MAG: TSUP family transporter, partial [Myxococcota bacterium]|nr:TSUP family transporter [Myxococcota bacterium]